jgi:hypothetical protein
MTASLTTQPNLKQLNREVRATGVNASLIAWDPEFDWTSTDLVVVRTTWDYFTRLGDFLRGPTTSSGSHGW